MKSNSHERPLPLTVLLCPEGKLASVLFIWVHNEGSIKTWGYWCLHSQATWLQVWSWSRLIHSPNLVAIGLSVGYDTWDPIGWYHAFMIDWSKYRLGLPSAPLHYGLMWLVGIPTVFHTPVTVPFHSPNGVCKGIVKESSPAKATKVNHWCYLGSGPKQHQT